MNGDLEMLEYYKWCWRTVLSAWRWIVADCESFIAGIVDNRSVEIILHELPMFYVAAAITAKADPHVDRVRLRKELQAALQINGSFMNADDPSDVSDAIREAKKVLSNYSIASD